MKIIIQKVKNASVHWNGEEYSSISTGYLVSVGYSKDYTEEKSKKAAEKIINLRLWESDGKRFNKTIRDIEGEILLVSQYTLFANLNKGGTPNFSNAADMNLAIKAYDHTKIAFNSLGILVKEGKFGEYFEIYSVNIGPASFILEY